MYTLFFKAIILRFSPERAHHLAMAGLKAFWWVPALLHGSWWFPRSRSAVRAMGIEFPGTLGLAAGFDKDATAVIPMTALGFGFVEIGTITAHGQPGNEAPRSWRELDVRGLRNRMGFNNHGCEVARMELANLRETKRGAAAIVGVNIGKTKATPMEDAVQDYVMSARALAPFADYLVVNVSSPNTPGLRDLQSTEALRPILTEVRKAADSVTEAHVPLLVKIAPDLADEDVDAVAALALELKLDGVVATNTTIQHDRGAGGLSGPPVKKRALEVVARLRAGLGPEPVIMGVGGIETLADAREFLDAGATLLQGYTGFIYGGPTWAAKINARLGN